MLNPWFSFGLGICAAGIRSAERVCRERAANSGRRSYGTAEANS